MVARDRLSLLVAAPVFGDMSIDILRAVALVCTPRTFLPNAVILNQDQQVEDLYLIASGHVKLIRELPKRDDFMNTAEFLGRDSDSPFASRPATNNKYAHVQSPVKVYRQHEPDNAALRQHRACVLASGRAKVLLVQPCLALYLQHSLARTLQRMCHMYKSTPQHRHPCRFRSLSSVCSCVGA